MIRRIAVMIVQARILFRITGTGELVFIIEKVDLELMNVFQTRNQESIVNHIKCKI